MALPLNQNLSQMQTLWKSQLDQLLANPLNQIVILKNVQLEFGDNVINHKLGRVQQGWFLTDIQGEVFVYRPPTSSFNNLTLTLNSSGDVTVNIGVF